MKGKAIIPLVLGLGVGILAVKLAMDTIRKAQAGGKDVEMVMVVRMTQDIRAFDEIQQDMLEVVETSDTTLIPAEERIEDPSAVVGRVVSKSVSQGSVLMLSMLAPEGTPVGMVGRIPPGFRAVSVRIDEVTSAGFQIRPGDWVDVVVVMDVNSGTGAGRHTIAKVILQNVQVAAIGRSSDTGRGVGSQKSKPAQSATLFVAEADVPKLHLAVTQGRVTLAMRGADAGISENFTSATMDDLTGNKKPKTDKTDALDFMAKLFAQAQQANQSSPGNQIEDTEPAPTHSVMVVRPSAGGSTRDSTERITFANADSSVIINISAGLPTGNELIVGSSEDQPGSRNKQTKRPGASIGGRGK